MEGFPIDEAFMKDQEGIEDFRVAMQQVNKAGQSKLLPKCDLPLTGVKCVKKIVTELGVYEIIPQGGFKLLERAPGISVDEIKNATAGKLIIEGDIQEMIL